MKKVIICDIDGTVAIKGDRSIFDYSKCGLDSINKPIVELIKMIPKNITIIFCSGREDFCLLDTEDWLKKNVTNNFKIFMRKSGDFRKDSIIKEEIYHNNIENRYEILFVLDDRTQVVEMWRSLGLTCLQVSKGDF